MIRLFNPTGDERRVTLRLGDGAFPLSVSPFSFETYLYDGTLSKIRADEI